MGKNSPPTPLRKVFGIPSVPNAAGCWIWANGLISSITFPGRSLPTPLDNPSLAGLAPMSLKISDFFCLAVPWGLFYNLPRSGMTPIIVGLLTGRIAHGPAIVNCRVIGQLGAFF